MEHGQVSVMLFKRWRFCMVTLICGYSHNRIGGRTTCFCLKRRSGTCKRVKLYNGIMLGTKWWSAASILWIEDSRESRWEVRGNIVEWTTGLNLYLMWRKLTGKWERRFDVNILMNKSEELKLLSMAYYDRIILKTQMLFIEDRKMYTDLQRTILLCKWRKHYI